MPKSYREDCALPCLLCGCGSRRCTLSGGGRCANKKEIGVTK
nr:MAG TPA: hypothetical protein [Bacteriophage sp.]